MTKYAFLNYAALYWGTYVKQQSTDGITKLVIMIVEHESGCPPCAIQALYLIIEPSYPFFRTIPNIFSGIHVIAYLVEEMSCFTEVELKDDTGRTPLSWAAGSGQEAVMQLLIKRGDIGVHTKDKSGKTPFIWAAENGHEAVVQPLIERGNIEINAKDYEGNTALIMAAYNGHKPP